MLIVLITDPPVSTTEPGPTTTPRPGKSKMTNTDANCILNQTWLPPTGAAICCSNY